MKGIEEKQADTYLTTAELMNMLAISRSTIYRLIADGMPYIKVGSVNRFGKEEVLSWLGGDDESEKAQAILQRGQEALQKAQEILEKVRNMQKQWETTR